MVRTMTDEYIQMVNVREEWWKAQLQRVRERQTVWEECSQTVVKEGEVLERELPMRFAKDLTKISFPGMFNYSEHCDSSYF